MNKNFLFTSENMHSFFCEICKISKFLPSLSKDGILDCAQFLRRKASLECKASNFVDAQQKKNAQFPAEIAFDIQPFLEFRFSNRELKVSSQS